MNQLGNGPWFDSSFHFFTCDIWQEPTIEGYGQVAEGGKKGGAQALLRFKLIKLLQMNH
jgi:hypothetical protein